MKPKKATFLVSATKPSNYPREDLLEVAFAGRSNVGKSSLINALVGVERLAKTSNTPGRTRLINWFRVEPAKAKPLFFVDLPGYGYAKVPREMRDSWRPMVEQFLLGRDVLRAVVLLIDARRGPQSEEDQLCQFLVEHEIPVILALTKIDKLSKSKRKPTAFAAQKQLGLKRPPVVTSAEHGLGTTELWSAILKHCGR